MSRFSPKDVCLNGINLIEASAGTGKTYSIAAIFLRLILEGKPVESILAVTYTRAATAELKNRLLEFLRTALKYFEDREAKKDEPVIASIIEEYSEKPEKHELLKRALLNFDKCPVFTIHGFCSKIVRENAFESGSRFNLELTKDGSKSIDEAVIDFWRKYSGLSDEQFLIEVSDKPWFSVEELKKMMKGRYLCEKPHVFPEIERKDLSWEINQKIFKENNSLNDEFCTDCLILVDRLFNETKNYIIRKREQTGKMSFDDLISILETALNRNDSFSRQLVNVMEKKYSAILIDEFQDTDPVQYNIFTKLFGKTKNPVFYIGDPKQSIYSFRNADVFAYLKVSSDTNIIKHSMDKNFRSSPAAVKAVNTLFSTVEKPFILDETEIGYKPVVPLESKPENNLKKHGVMCHGLEIRYQPALGLNEFFTAGSKKFPEKRKIKIITLKNLFFNDVCSRIFEFLDRKNGYTIDNVPVKPNDITILVLKHSEASEIKSYLYKRGIPSVITSDKSVFKSKEMNDLLIVMEAVATLSTLKINAALLTIFFNITPLELLNISKESALFEKHSSFFSTIHENWEKNGFLSAFSTFLQNLEIYMNLSRKGERTLTNIRHLFELINNREIESGRSIETLLSWVKKKMTESDVAEDEQLHLESDDNSVSIMTVHKSKGLEFKIVFLPYFIKKTGSKKSWFNYYHDKSNDYRQVLSFNSQDENALKASKLEEMSENVRLLYVALTRAKYLTVFNWGNINSTGSTPLSKIIFDVTDDKVFKELNDSDLLNRVEKLADISNGTIKIVKKLLNSDEVYRKEASIVTITPERKLSNEISKNWSVTSFSAISSSKIPDKVSEFIDFSDEFIQAQEIETKKNAELDISFFPAGANAGTVLHSIFENIDFQSEDNDEIISTLLEKNNMRFHKSGSDMLPWIRKCVKNVLNAPLFEGSSLVDVNPENTVSEMEFFDSLSDINFEDISKISDINIKWKDSSMSGFIHGFIDLVFYHKGKYYIIDWKSNRLGDDYSCYKKENLKKEMIKHNYILQYLIYLTAFNSYISKRDKNYSYKKNFGGVFYIFIRGVTPENGYSTGIYSALPKEEIIMKIFDKMTT